MKFNFVFIVILLFFTIASSIFNLNRDTIFYIFTISAYSWILINVYLAFINRNKNKIENVQNEEERSKWEIYKNKYEEEVIRVTDLVNQCLTVSDMANLNYYKDAQLLMPPDEKIIFSIPVSATEDVEKTEIIKQRYQTSGFTFSFKIAGGLRYRSAAGEFRLSPQKREYIAKKDLGRGNLTLTNKRVIFDPIETTATNKVFTARTLLKTIPISSDEFLFEFRGKPILFDIVAESNPYCDSRVICKLIQKAFTIK